MNMKIYRNIVCLVGVLAAVVMLGGCSSGQQQHDRGFFTSGSREADQRADQRMANVEQLRDSGKPEPAKDVQKSLYDRLGGEKGIAAIVDDFVTRALADPRVNFERKGVTRGGMNIHRGQSMEWKASDANVEQLKKHLAQFLALSTGGPSFYDGKQMQDAHAGMHISNPEFDAAVGDLKATLDKVGVGDKEQRELLSIIESTRTQIVEER
jgi:hemoglobin